MKLLHDALLVATLPLTRIHPIACIAELPIPRRRAIQMVFLTSAT
jgi:hypothetical protein